MRMSRIVTAAAAAAIALLATPAFAKSQNEGDAAATGTKAKSDRKICRTFDNTASRLKREKVCLTREQWRKFDLAQ